MTAKKPPSHFVLSVLHPLGVTFVWVIEPAKQPVRLPWLRGSSPMRSNSVLRIMGRKGDPGGEKAGQSLLLQSKEMRREEAEPSGAQASKATMEYRERH